VGLGLEPITVALIQRGSRIAPKRVPKTGAGVDVYVLPENWLSPSPVDPEEYEAAVEELAAELGAPLVIGGAQYVREPDGTVKSVGVAYIEGRLTRICEKVFPSAAVGERGLVKPGVPLEPVSFMGWRISCVVCVDIFYPELARIHTLLFGATLIVNPAKIPVDRVGLWRSALLSRAAENEVYVVGVNAAAEKYRDGRDVEGGSAVYTPDGRPLLEAGWGVGVFTVELRPERINAARARWAFVSDAERLYSSLYREALRILHQASKRPQGR
jgi:predicted amidohydrolase